MVRKETIIYFAGAMRGDRSKEENMKRIVQFIKELGIPVLTEHVVADDPIEKIDVRQIEERDINWLNQATHVIAEVSGASTGVGREIEYGRTKHSFGHTPAKILCLYHADAEFKASPMIRGMTADRYHNVTVLPYRTIEEAREIIKKFLG